MTKISSLSFRLQLLRKKYGKLLRDRPLPEYSVTLEVDLRNLPEDTNELVHSLGLLKRNCFASVFETYFEAQANGVQKASAWFWKLSDWLVLDCFHSSYRKTPSSTIVTMRPCTCKPFQIALSWSSVPSSRMPTMLSSERCSCRYATLLDQKNQWLELLNVLAVMLTTLGTFICPLTLIFFVDYCVLWFITLKFSFLHHRNLWRWGDASIRPHKYSTNTNRRPQSWMGPQPQSVTTLATSLLVSDACNWSEKTEAAPHQGSFRSVLRVD